MKSLLLPLTLVAATTIAAPAFADCTAPTINVTVPEGAKATKEDLVATQRTLKELNVAVADFTTCLQNERDAKIAAGGDSLSDAARQKISAEYNTRGNAAIDKLQKIADKFNLEVRAYKAKQPAT
jgi:hypothetical protein